MLNNFRKEYPKFKYLFQFDEFNDVQKQCYPKIFNFSDNMIVSAPTSSGKTVLFQLLIAKLMTEKKTKCLYLAPIKSLCHEKFNSWRKKFMSTMNVMELTGDTLEMEPGQFGNADIYVATPQKIDYISRKNLNFLKELNLLLIDEIHMLNMQDRGAILQAIVSRIMSINKKIRIMAVSATIPNIKEVAQWLKVPSHLICVFGQQYRPAKLNKIVLGFKAANNDFNFQKMLNFKLLDIIRNYSFGRGTLIFCQTQKGTEQACNKLIQQARSRQFVPNEQLAMQLINSSKVVDNRQLKSLLPHGVAFHNASLSMKDRSIVEGLFLDFKVKVLCTTSTLAMGINLPARLVIIKSTKSYKGSGKGYQQYTQIQLDQMMGRAGRMPFDKEGTVVIMTEKNNYNKYIGNVKLQNLQSQLYFQFIDHLNTQISLKSIQSFQEAIQYFKNSFCYIRMLNAPKLYNLQSSKQIQNFVNETCMKSLKKLAQFQIIQFIENNNKIFPKQCSINISKNAIQVETIIRIIEHINEVKTQRQFINLLCQANELSKYRSKLDERKVLKDLNEKNKYTLKQTISNSEKKCFVLIQAQMSGIYIENWQLRRQASEMVYFFKRLSYCVKCLALERKNNAKNFWLYLFGCLFNKYFTQGFWQINDEKVLKQIKKVLSKWKNISARGIRSLNDLTYGLSKLDIFGNGLSSTAIKKAIEDQINLLNGSIQIISKKMDETQKYNNVERGTVSQEKQVNHLLKFIFTQNFDEKFRSVTIIIQLNCAIYITGYLNANCLEFSAYLKNTLTQKYFIAVIKDGYVGFDEFYWFQKGQLKKTQLKKQESDKKNVKNQNLELINQKRRSNKFFSNDQRKEQNENSFQKRQNNSLSSSLKRLPKINSTNKPQKNIPRQINYVNSLNKIKNKNVEYQSQDQNQNEEDLPDLFYQSNQKKSSKQEDPESYQSTLKINKRSKQLKLTENFKTIKRSFVHDEQYQQKRLQENPLEKQIKKSSNYRDLKSYNWKPGFQKIKEEKDYDFSNLQTQQETREIGKNQKKLLLCQEDSENTQTQKQKISKRIYGQNKFFQKNLDEFTFQQKTLMNYPNYLNFQSQNSSVINQKAVKQPPKATSTEKYPFLNKKSSQFHHSKITNTYQNSLLSKQQNNKIFPNDSQLFQPNKSLISQGKKGSNKKIPFKAFLEDLQKPIIGKNPLNQQIPERKKFKSAYEYFESFLSDYED